MSYCCTLTYSWAVEKNIISLYFMPDHIIASTCDGFVLLESISRPTFTYITFINPAVNSVASSQKWSSEVSLKKDALKIVVWGQQIQWTRFRRDIQMSKWYYFISRVLDSLRESINSEWIGSDQDWENDKRQA